MNETERAEATDDSALVVAAREGDGDAFALLMDRYQPLVIGICTRMMGSSSDARELAHDAFVEAYLHLAQLNQPERFAGWLRTLTLNLCRMWCRRNRQMLVELPEDLPDPDSVTAASDDDESAVLARMSWGLSELSAAHRLVLVLHYYEDLSYEEMARFLEVPVGTVMSRLHRARLALKEILERTKQDQEIPVVTDERFKQEVMAEIAVLLRMFPEEPSARERLSVVLGPSSERLREILEHTDDPALLDNLALLLPHLGPHAMRQVLDAAFSSDASAASSAESVIRSYVARCRCTGWRGWRPAGKPYEAHMLLDELIASAGSDAAKAELVLDMIESSDDEATVVFFTNFLLCYEDAAFPLLIERFRSAVSPARLYDTPHVLAGLCRTAARFVRVLLEMLDSPKEADVALAVTGMEAVARCILLGRKMWDPKGERLMEELRRRPVLSPDAIGVGLLEAVTRKMARLLEGDRADLRDTTIRVFGLLQAREWVAAVRRCAAHPVASTRSAALLTLADLEDRDSVALCMRMAEDRQESERRTAIEALSRLKAREAIPLLIGLIEDADGEVRRAAVVALDDLGGEEADAAIAGLIGSSDKKIRKLAASVLQRERTSPRAPRQPSELAQQRLTRICPEPQMDTYISTDAVMRFALPEIGPFEEAEFTSRIASVCSDFSTTRRWFVMLGLVTRTHPASGRTVYEFSELGKAAWRVEQFIVARYMRRVA